MQTTKSTVRGSQFKHTSTYPQQVEALTSSDNSPPGVKKSVWRLPLLTNHHTPNQWMLLTNLCTLNHLSIQGACHAPYDESMVLPLHSQN